VEEIQSKAKKLRSLLGEKKFAIEYYQREYRWGRKQVTELIDDLAERFGDNYNKSHERNEVENYSHYFLGSIIISKKESKNFIIDGQQRLTTLTLLLIHVYRLLEDDKDEQTKIASLIFSTHYGTRSFNIDVEERVKCMEALFNGNSFDEAGQPESVTNIVRRFQDITDSFPDELAKEALPYFSDWLIENVYIVEISAQSDADAYTIFETMNDRGLSLTPTDMLKGYILANIQDPERRDEANQFWRNQVAYLKKIGKEEDADAIKAWLRSQFANSIREPKRNAEPRDFDLIGTEFHRWVRDNKEDLGLSSSDDFFRFIEVNFAFYGRWYSRLREAAKEIKEGLEAIHYCAQSNFTLQYPVLLAALECHEAECVILQKLRIVSTYLDILIARRIWNFRSISYSTMRHAMFTTMREIRGKDARNLADLLMERLESEKEIFATNDRFHLHGTNRPQIHRLLARLTDYVETSSGHNSHFRDYMGRGGKNVYEIEHVWADHFEDHSDEFDHPNDFAQFRNRIGGLLLLPKSDNASYGDLPYEKKRHHYLKQNLLARSLHEEAYERDPGFKQFIHSSKLAFKAHPEFRKGDLEARQHLYTKLAEQIWDPERLARAAES